VGPTAGKSQGVIVPSDGRRGPLAVLSLRWKWGLQRAWPTSLGVQRGRWFNEKQHSELVPSQRAGHIPTGKGQLSSVISCVVLTTGVG
jgi:hypothetical protein